MKFDLDRRRIELSVGELSGFQIGPQGSLGGGGGIWRAQLGTHWHQQLRAQAEADDAGALFEVPVEGILVRRGWTVALAGRIDQILSPAQGPVLREIKTVSRTVPAPEEELRADYPDYFVQLATYSALRAQGEACELLFVEADTGLAQVVPLRAEDHALLSARLDRIAEFLDLRLRARERLRGLRYRKAFAQPRHGQEEALAGLCAAAGAGNAAVLFEAPTGFGKTGVLLECALGMLRAGTFERLVYLTSKSTGQLHVARTLRGMTERGPDLGDGPPVAAWHVRNKAEHCVNDVFQCVREACGYLDGAEKRWPQSGLSRFYLLEDEARDLPTLRAAGSAARICPYEITRASLAFNDVWIGDYNYVFSPESRSLFYERPGFDPARTLLVVDEAHNLPSRAADAHSHAFEQSEAFAVADALRDSGADQRWVAEWEAWAAFLASLGKSAQLEGPGLDDARERIARLAAGASAYPTDYAAVGSLASAAIWRMPAVTDQLEAFELPRLWWSPRGGDLSITCLDAAAAIGRAVGGYGGAIFATATPGPAERFAESCGVGEPALVRAAAPWRDGAYDVAVDVRVDTTFQQRAHHARLTAETVDALHASASGGAVAVFFPSFAYAEMVAEHVLGAAVQPRRSDLSAQNAWIEQGLGAGAALFLVLGSGFAEGIDLLGGRVGRAMVVGPALPEVNAVQRARMSALAGAGRDAAFDRVYRIPGMQKVNQALGRLVRAPGQAAKVLLHCRRFAEEDYERLLAPEYRGGRTLTDAEELAAWLGRA
ncbi:MAG TPA: helicase C-terminal domain-containing protein [Opitutaceae bacterium]